MTTAVETPPAWLTPADVADELRVSAMTVYRLISRGELPASKVGGQFRIDRERLHAWLNAQENV